MQIKKKIFYWSPCLNPVGTVKSTLNSAIALSKYNKEYDVKVINVCGEWNAHVKQFNKNNVDLINLNFNYFQYLPKEGYFQSRFSYLVIYILSFISLRNLLKKEEPNFIILHLITSLPLTLLRIFKFKTNFILRISGYPKLNIFRKFLWKISSIKLKSVTSPSIELKDKLVNNKIFTKEKLFFLPDAILDLDKKFNDKSNQCSDFKYPEGKKIILSAGRLTKQKNFSYLIDEFETFVKENNEFILLILGEGEERKNLELLIHQKNLQNKVFLHGYVKNIDSYMKKSQVFVLSSLWEEVGFVIVEAAFNNLFVISSDCPNGPSEFLNYGKNGILYKSSKKNALAESLFRFTKLSKEKILLDRFKLKNNAKKYTKYQHNLKLVKLLIDRID